jgi:hypothetical protein
LFVAFGGTVRLNWLKFQPVDGGGPGTGGTGEGGTTDGSAGGAGGRIVLTGTGGSAGGGAGGSTSSGGSTGVIGGGAGSGCACGIGAGGWPPATLALAGVIAAVLFGARRHRARRGR